MSAAPIPGSWIKPTPKQEKKPFILPEHLTVRPLRKDPALMALKKRLKKGNDK